MVTYTKNPARHSHGAERPRQYLRTTASFIRSRQTLPYKLHGVYYLENGGKKNKEKKQKGTQKKKKSRAVVPRARQAGRQACMQGYAVNWYTLYFQ